MAGFCIWIIILLTGSINQFQNCESWMFFTKFDLVEPIISISVRKFQYTFLLVTFVLQTTLTRSKQTSYYLKCFEKWYFVTKIVLTFCVKKLFKWSRKTLEIRGWRPRGCKMFEITRTIYSNSERSEQFLVTECFFNLFLEVSHIW